MSRKEFEDKKREHKYCNKKGSRKLLTLSFLVRFKYFYSLINTMTHEKSVFLLASTILFISTIKGTI